MTDYSDAEIHAIGSVFPECKVYLCDFHREQAWERWVKDKKSGMVSHLPMVKFFLESSEAVPGHNQDQMVHLSVETPCRNN